MIAICNVGHPGSFDSLTLMLRAVGWIVKRCGPALRSELKACGLDTIVCPAAMAKGWGGELATAPHEEATVADLKRSDVVFVCSKAHRNGPKLVERYPNLAGRVLWYRINGARPCIVPGKGDELDPPCPVLTPDPWYDASRRFNCPGLPEWDPALPLDTLLRSYSAWPPFARWNEFQRIARAVPIDGAYYSDPVCLVHNLDGWGYGEVGAMLSRSVGLRLHGGYGSPGGLMPMRRVPAALAEAVCCVHLKSQDCPGYSLYEALAAGCPVVVSRAMIDWCHMEPLFEEGATCLCYDARLPKGYGKTGATPPIDAAECAREAEECVARLRNPELNRRIGEAGRERLKSLMWRADHPADVASLALFLQRQFP